MPLETVLSDTMSRITPPIMPPTMVAERHRMVNGSGCVSGRREGPAVWLPWCVAPLWVFLPIVGCLLAGAVRRPAVAGGPPQPAATVGPASELITVSLVPIPPLVDIEPQ